MKNYNIKALIAEDDIVSLKLMSIYLQKLGVMVDSAKDGLTLLGKYLTNPHNYDILFMDIHMPVMDGIQTAVEILEFEKEENIPHTPIIAVTTNIFEGKITKSIDDYILKPVNQTHFEEIIKKHIIK